MKRRLEHSKEFLLQNKTFCLSIVLIVAIMFYRYNSGVVQQDDYIGYSKWLSGKIHFLAYVKSRFFPGLPILISLVNLVVNDFIVSAYLIVLISYIASYLLLKNLTGSTLSWLPLVFPPIMFDVATKVANEYVLITLLLSVYYLFKNNKLNHASLVAGVSVFVRPTGTLIFPAILITLLAKRRKVEINNFIFFFIPILIFTVFNQINFNSFSPFYQLLTYRKVSPYGNAIGFIQIIKDLKRSLNWGQYHIFLSGAFYMTFLLWSVKQLFFTFKRLGNENILLILLTVSFYVLAVLSYTFVPTLENFARYIAPIIPLIWLVLYDDFKTNKFYYLLPLISVYIILS